MQKFEAIGVALAFLMISAGNLVAAPPVVTHVFPPGGQRGTKVVVKCTGTFTWPCKVWAPGVEVIPATESGQLEVSIPADLAADRVWIRLYNSEGASALIPFLIGGLKEISEVEPNDRPRASQVIENSVVTINGSLKNADVDCFSVQLAAGQTLVSAVDANTRLGSPIDAILQVVSPTGVVLAENHDDLKLDPRLAFTAVTAGTYVVRLFAFASAPNTSIQFSGGADSIYRLTLTTGPFATHTIPLSVPLSNSGSVKVAGWNIPPELLLQVTPFGGQPLSEFREMEALNELRRDQDAQIGFASSPDFQLATRVRLTSQQVLQVATANDPKTPMPIPISSSVTGCLSTRRQSDHFQLALLKGQHVVISVESRSLDLPLDPSLKLVGPTGSAISDTDDTGSTRDAAIAYTATSDGEYKISVSDRLHQGGDRCWYLLTVRLDEPDFELSAASDTITVSLDKPTDLAVKVLRRGLPADAVGPISIQVVGLPEGVSSAAVVSESTGPTATEVKLTLTGSGVPFSGTVRIVGTASQVKPIKRTSRTPAKLGVSFETFWLTVAGKP